MATCLSPAEWRYQHGEAAAKSVGEAGDVFAGRGHGLGRNLVSILRHRLELLGHCLRLNPRDRSTTSLRLKCRGAGDHALISVGVGTLWMLVGWGAGGCAATLVQVGHDSTARFRTLSRSRRKVPGILAANHQFVLVRSIFQDGN